MFKKIEEKFLAIFILEREKKLLLTEYFYVGIYFQLKIYNDET